MKYKSLVYSEASGSIGGITYSHNAGGQYTRVRRTPTDPGSQPQFTIRSIVGALVNHWVDTLTTAQRNAWATYAANVPINDVFGDPRHRSGINHYVRSNVPRIQAGAPRVDDGPTIFNLGSYTLPTITASESTQEISVAFTVADDWVDEDDSYLIAWSSRPQNPTINFFKGPYRLLGSVEGDSAAAPTSPEAIASPFAFVEAQKLFAKFNVSRADGRLSLVTRNFCTAAA